MHAKRLPVRETSGMNEPPLPDGVQPVNADLPDEELLQAIQAGNSQAFQFLVDRHTKRVYWTARNIVHDHEESEDIAQETFIRVYRFLDRYDPTKKFTAWLYQIAVNLAIDKLRKRKKKLLAALDNVPEVAGDQEEPFEQVQRSEQQERVREALKGLPEQYRIILVLRDIEGLPSREVASVLNINHATVRWRLHRARELFKEVWETRHGNEI